MPGIPTEYANICFRSRLEARWAVFFDEVGWPWQYEPLDLSGYIPDFVLPLGWDGEERPLLVEVKPAMYVTQLEAAVPKLRRSGWGGDALIVGGTIFEQYDTGHDIIGIIVSDGSSLIARAFECTACERLGFAGNPNLAFDEHGCVVSARNDGRWPCRLCGDTGTISMGGHCVDADRTAGTRSALMAWAKAGNAVQWRGGYGA